MLALLKTGTVARYELCNVSHAEVYKLFFTDMTAFDANAVIHSNFDLFFYARQKKQNLVLVSRSLRNRRIDDCMDVGHFLDFLPIKISLFDNL